MCIRNEEKEVCYMWGAKCICIKNEKKGLMPNAYKAINERKGFVQYEVLKGYNAQCKKKPHAICEVLKE